MFYNTIMKINKFIFIIPILSTCLFNCKESSGESFNVTWVNYDGTILRKDRVNKNAVPQYSSETPKKPSTKEFDFVFNSWSPHITPANSDIVYTATYEETFRKYKISFYNDEGKTELLDQISKDYGSIPEYLKTTPTKAKDAQYTYTFDGWYPDPHKVTGDQEYIAKYKTTVNNYTVTWKNDNGEVLKTDTNVPYGTTPSYTGATPTKQSTDQYTYTFSHWNPQIAPISSDTTYTAQYAKNVNKYTITAQPQGQGTVSGGGEFNYGESCTLKAISNTGYRFVGWYDENDVLIEGAPANYTFTVTGAKTLNAKFEQDKYTVSVTPIPEDAGTITLSKSSEILYDEAITLEATPQGNYVFGGYYDGDELLSTQSSFNYIVRGTKQLKAKFVTNKSFETCTWKYISDACDALEKANFTDEAKKTFCDSFTINGKTPASLDDFVGIKRNVVINNQNHGVRVIGTHHDVNENDQKLALTFEFTNLISDSNGDSLAYIWDNNTSNKSYRNSDIRFALTGLGKEATSPILTAVKAGTDFNNDYKDKTIFSMLPKDLQEVLKTTKKDVGSGEYYKQEYYTDTLFMLSAIEMGFSTDSDKGYGSYYSYYGTPEYSANEKRIKKQVNNSAAYCVDSTIITSDKGPTISNITNFAGYNGKVEASRGGLYWLRSPVYNSDQSFYGDSNGWLKTFVGREKALAVAPAFCI